MSDAIIDLQASNIFGLSTNFKTTSSGTTTESTNVTVMDEYGNVSCETNITDITSVTQNAGYCGTDFVSDLGTFLTQFGDVQTSNIVTGITINMTAGEYCTIDIEGHNHDVNPHIASDAGDADVGYADMSDFLPHELTESFSAWTGFGVPNFGITEGDNASPSSATVTFSMTHVDDTDANGDHLVGKNITPRAELSMDFSGIPTSNILALLNVNFAANTNSMLGAIADTVDSNDSNSEFDSFALTAHAHTDLVTA